MKPLQMCEIADVVNTAREHEDTDFKALMCFDLETNANATRLVLIISWFPEALDFYAYPFPGDGEKIEVENYKIFTCLTKGSRQYLYTRLKEANLELVIPSYYPRIWSENQTAH